MANSTQVTALAASIQRKSIYRCNVQVIPVTLVPDANASHVVSGTMPPNTYVIGVQLGVSALAGSATLDIGYGSDAATKDLIIDGVSVSSAALVTFPAASNGTDAGDGSPVDVSGKILTITTIGGTYSSETIGGFITIATDE